MTAGGREPPWGDVRPPPARAGTGRRRQRIATCDLLVPSEFPGGPPIEQLAEAWPPGKGAIELFNRVAWLRPSQSREAERQTREARATALARQLHVLECWATRD